MVLLWTVDDRFDRGADEQAAQRNHLEGAKVDFKESAHRPSGAVR